MRWKLPLLVGLLLCGSANLAQTGELASDKLTLSENRPVTLLYYDFQVDRDTENQSLARTMNKEFHLSLTEAGTCFVQNWLKGSDPNFRFRARWYLSPTGEIKLVRVEEGEPPPAAVEKCLALAFRDFHPASLSGPLEGTVMLRLIKGNLPIDPSPKGPPPVVIDDGKSGENKDLRVFY